MFVIIGRNLLGVVAQDKTDMRSRADKLAAAWRQSGLAVEVEEVEEARQPATAAAEPQPAKC